MIVLYIHNKLILQSIHKIGPYPLNKQTLIKHAFENTVKSRNRKHCIQLNDVTDIDKTSLITQIIVSTDHEET